MAVEFDDIPVDEAPDFNVFLIAFGLMLISISCIFNRFVMFDAYYAKETDFSSYRLFLQLIEIQRNPSPYYKAPEAQLIHEYLPLVLDAQQHQGKINQHDNARNIHEVICQKLNETVPVLRTFEHPGDEPARAVKSIEQHMLRVMYFMTLPESRIEYLVRLVKAESKVVYFFNQHTKSGFAVVKQYAKTLFETYFIDRTDKQAKWRISPLHPCYEDLSVFLNRLGKKPEFLCEHLGPAGMPQQQRMKDTVTQAPPAPSKPVLPTPVTVVSEPPLERDAQKPKAKKSRKPKPPTRSKQLTAKIRAQIAQRQSERAKPKPVTPKSSPKRQVKTGMPPARPQPAKAVTPRAPVASPVTVKKPTLSSSGSASPATSTISSTTFDSDTSSESRAGAGGAPTSVKPPPFDVTHFPSVKWKSYTPETAFRFTRCCKRPITVLDPTFKAVLTLLQSLVLPHLSGDMFDTFRLLIGGSAIGPLLNGEFAGLQQDIDLYFCGVPFGSMAEVCSAIKASDAFAAYTIQESHFGTRYFDVTQMTFSGNPLWPDLDLNFYHQKDKPGALVPNEMTISAQNLLYLGSAKVKVLFKGNDASPTHLIHMSHEGFLRAEQGALLPGTLLATRRDARAAFKQLSSIFVDKTGTPKDTVCFDANTIRAVLPWADRLVKDKDNRISILAMFLVCLDSIKHFEQLKPKAPMPMRPQGVLLRQPHPGLARQGHWPSPAYSPPLPPQ